MSIMLWFVPTVPGVVTSLQVRPSNTTYGLIITWGPPSGSNYTTPVAYRVRYRERPSSGSLGVWNSTVVRSATGTMYITPALKPGTWYEVEVWTVSGDVEGNHQNVTVKTLKGTYVHSLYPIISTYNYNIFQKYGIIQLRNFILNFISFNNNILYCFVHAAPGPVTALSVTSHPTAIALIVTWQPPTGPNSLPVEGYTVQYRESPNGEWSRVVQTSAQTNQYTLSGLQPATTYDVQVWAFSSIG